MTQSMSTGGASSGRSGEDYVCPNCGCEVMVKHWGDPRSHVQSSFTCHCGQQMEPEHAGSQASHGGSVFGSGEGDANSAEGDGNFSQDDFLGQGGGAGEATGMGRTSSSASSPGGGEQ